MRVFLKTVAKRSAYVLAGIIIIAAIFVVAIRLLTPILDEHRDKFEKMASDLLQSPVLIKSVRVSWFQYQPVISLNEVTILNKGSTAPLFQIKKVNLLFSISRSLWQRTFVTSGIMIAGSSVTINQSSTGEFTVQGFSELGINAQPYQNETKISDVLAWLSRAPHLILRDIDVRYTGFNQQKRFVTLYDLNIQNSDANHIVLGKAVLHQALPMKASIAIEWTGQEVDLNKIDAKIYLYVSSLSLSQWAKGMLWKDWLVNDGIVSAKIWASWQGGLFQKIQSEFQAYNLSLYSGTDKSTHKINRLSGNVGWKREGDQFIFAGDDIFIDLPNHLWPATNFYLALAKDASGVLTPKTAHVAYVDIADIQPFMVSFPGLLSESMRSTLSTLTLKGEVQNVAATFGVSWDDINQLVFNGNFKRVSFMPWKKLPGLSNVSGAITWHGSGGEVKLESKRASFQYDSVFSNTVNLDQILGSLQFQRQLNQSWVITIPSLGMMNNDLAANIAGTLTLPVTGLPITDLNANFTLQKAERIASYLPTRVLDAELVKWLQQAFLSGEVKSGHAVLHGNLADYPFDQGNGVFSISGNVNQVDFRFAPDWPVMHQVQGALVFSGRKLVVDVDHASTLGIPLSNVHAVIPYLGDAQPQIVNVKADTIKTDFTLGMAYVHSSPLEANIGKMFKGVDLSGPIDLKLDLSVPLSNPDKTTVKGELTMADAVMDMKPWNLKIDNLNGQVNFTENTSDAKNIQGVLFGNPLQFDLATIQKSKNLSVVRAGFKSILNMTDLETWLAVPFSKVMKGSADVNGYIDFSLNSPMDIHLQSDLAGVTVNLADDFGKKAQDIKAFTSNITIQEGKPIRLQLTYGDLVDSALVLDRHNQKINLVSGNLHFGTGQAAWPVGPGLTISGDFDALDWEKVKSYLPSDAASSKQDMLPSSIKLNMIDVKAKSFKLGGQEFTQLHVLAKPEDKNWGVNIDSNELIGQLTIPAKLNRQAQISGQFDKINMHSLAGSGGSSMMLDLKSMPSLSIVANDVRFNNMPLGQITFKAVPGGNGLTIQTLRLSSPRVDLRASGEWSRSGKNYLTRLQGAATTTQVSELLNSLGMDAHNFISSKGDLNFNLSWADAPYAPTLSSMNGNASLKLGPGRIIDIGKENGAKMDLGRLLSIFSLQTIPRRLSLDFSDVFQQGYSFDSVRGDFTIQGGDIFTKNFRFEGPVAGIGINGRIGLRNKDFDFILNVNAHVTSSIPVAATLLTGNPLIGLGALAVNSVIGSQVSSAVSNSYSVTGSWANPNWKAVKVGSGR